MNQITKEDIDNIMRAVNNGANKEAIIDFLLDLRQLITHDK